jgi:hypothetical protein
MTIGHQCKTNGLKLRGKYRKDMALFSRSSEARLTNLSQ